MVQYCGGKQRLAKKIAPRVLQDNPRAKVWTEPFCGMCSVAVEAHRLKPELVCRLSDGNPSLVLMLNAIRGGWVPHLPSLDEYAELKSSTEPSALKGWVCTQLSYGGLWFKGRVGVNNQANSYEYYHQTGVNTLPKLRNFLAAQPPVECKLFEMVRPRAGVVYADPPYTGTEKYYPVAFDQDRFLAWANTVTVPLYLTEYFAGANWSEIEDLGGPQHLSRNSRRTSEKLFVWTSPPKQT